MPLLTLRGVTVDFPFPPYDCQRDYMDKVLQCLQTKVNGVLESPTGTGKTLCLLCAALAWRQNFKDTISARKISERLGGEQMFPASLASWGTAATDGDTPGYYTDVPRIIYASRTHSQLAQVIGELRNTSYSPKVCVLGSREQLCIHPEVQRQESNHVKVHMCRGKVSSRSCSYYNNVEEKSTDRDLNCSILDVEDLVKFGVKQKVCPYYLSRSLKQQADVIFMPYNYLLDPKSRRAHNIELSGAVVIFDEAHNVVRKSRFNSDSFLTDETNDVSYIFTRSEKTCEESTSFDLTPYDVASAVAAVDRLLEEQAKDAVSHDFDVESLASGLKMDVRAIGDMKQRLLDLEAAIDSYQVQDDRGVTKPGIFIYELLERANLTYGNKTAVSDDLLQRLAHRWQDGGIFQNTSGLQKLNDIIQLVFCGEAAEQNKQQLMHNNTAHFKVHIHRDTKRKPGADVWAATSSKKQGNILSYWCFSPGFSMQDLVNQGVRSLILTSGTLSPLSSFTSEMRIDFPVTLENRHVIERDQIFVSVMERGPDGVQLSSAFDRRFVPENMASLGNTVANLSRVVPHGLLVFFPSFPLMEKTLDFWKANGQANRIESVKPMFVEPKGKGTFNEVMEGFYRKVKDPAAKGGSFFAVCRGKASEGLDFADTFGRGVVITGLPFPPRLDPRVVLKMQFLDEMSRKRAPGVKYLSGQEWYRQQAFRAVNQAIGRVIRHKDDFGAIFLCDQRFKSADARAHLPSWVRPYVRPYDSFGNVVRDVAQFFRVAHKLRPVAVKEEAAAASDSRPAPRPSSGASSASSSEGSCYAPRAAAPDAHLPSLKRKRSDDVGGACGGGMARICVEYESEGQEGRRRPVSLLAALERGDGDRGAAGGGGEEGASRWSTLALQQEKRRDEEARGGKRRIRLLQEQTSGVPADAAEGGKAHKAKRFLADMRASLSQVSFHAVVQALQTYKKTDDLDRLLAETSVLVQDANTHGLLRGFYQFVRPHHKKRFEQRCVALTGRGCGYRPDHSLPRGQRDGEADSAPAAARPSSSSSSSSSCDQLATQQLNGGGAHLSRQGLTQPPPPGNHGAAPSTAVHAAFLSDVKKALGGEETARLFHAVRRYKTSDRYEDLVATVVDLLTQRDQDFGLLDRFSMFVRPHHKKRYREMLESLAGHEPSAAESKDQTEAAPSPPPNTQTKISSFFLKP